MYITNVNQLDGLNEKRGWSGVGNAHNKYMV